jgi:hypothetical protein
MIEDRSLFPRLRRGGGLFLAFYSGYPRLWFRLANVDATFAEPVELGMVADDSFVRMPTTLSVRQTETMPKTTREDHRSRSVSTTIGHDPVNSL